MIIVYLNPICSAPRERALYWTFARFACDILTLLLAGAVTTDVVCVHSDFNCTCSIIFLNKMKTASWINFNLGTLSFFGTCYVCVSEFRRCWLGDKMDGHVYKKKPQPLSAKILFQTSGESKLSGTG